MKDIYFKDNGNSNKKYETGKIPLSDIERRRQDEINRRRYQEIVRKQQQNKNTEQQTDYDPYEFEPYPKQKYTQYRSTQYQPNGNSDYQFYNVPRQNKPQVRQVYQEPPKQEHSPVKKKKKNKGCGCTTLFLCFILIVALLCGGTFGYVYSLCGKTDYEESPYRTTSSDVMSDSTVYNILLIGCDRKNEDGTTRSDSMMLLSIDTNNKKLKFTSIMRDIWVTIPGYGDAKLNAAYAYGGTSLLLDTIEKTFKVKIDNYVTVNFDMFKSLIDGLGGVEVDITEEEAEFINRTSHAKVTSGRNTLNGDYALIFCRIRKLDSDFNRTERQRQVMKSILDKARQNPLSIVNSAGDVLENITTDIPQMDMTLEAFKSPKYLSYDFEQLRIPIDGEFEDQMVDGQEALVIDFDTNIEAIQNFIYE